MPLHPAIVHAPLGLALGVPILLLVLTIGLFRNKVSPRALWAAALMQAVVVAGGVLALLTGQAEEERVESIVAEAAIEHHEHLATAFVIAAAVTAVIVVVAAVRQRWARGLAALGTAASIGVLGLGLAVGHAGGALVYRDGAASVYASSAPQQATVESRNALDDD